MPKDSRDDLRERQTSSGLSLLQVLVVALALGHTSSRGLCDTALPMSVWSLLGGRTGPRSDRFYAPPGN